jgi:predicted DCC family thiol-disulfide oxidoreductase YuxK
MLMRPVLLYDGQCAFCLRWVRRLQRWDRDGALDFVAAAERGRVAGLPDISAAALDQSMHLVTPDGAVYAGGRAVPVLLRYLPGGRWLRPWFRLPGVAWATDRGYRWVAARRHRFGCGAESCGV